MDMSERSVIWEDPRRLCGIDRIRQIPCESEAEVAGLKRNESHLLLGTCECFYAEVDRALEFVEEVFAFRDAEGWARQKVFYFELFYRFFPQNSDAPAWVSINPCYVPFESRFEVKAEIESHEEDLEPDFDNALKINEISKSQLDLHFGIGAPSGKYFLLAREGDDLADDPFGLIEQIRKRDVGMGDYFGGSTDLLLYAARRFADEQRWRQGHVPAISVHYEPERDLLKTYSFTVAKMTRQADHEITQVVSTFDPRSGETTSLAPGRREARTYLLQYPLEHDLLLQGIGA